MTQTTRELSILKSLPVISVADKNSSSATTKASISVTAVRKVRAVSSASASTSTSSLKRPVRTLFHSLSSFPTIIIAVVTMSLLSVLYGATKSAALCTGGIVKNRVSSISYRRYAPLSTNHLLMVSSSRTNGENYTNQYKNTNLTGYSATTQKRIQGLNAKQEFSTLAMKLKKTEQELHLVLTKRLASNGAVSATDKEEYVEWLVTGFEGEQPRPPQQQEESPSKPKRKVPSSSTTVQQRVLQTESQTDGQEQQTFATSVQFADRTDIHPQSKRAIAQMGLVSMTEIQDKTFSAASSGRDVLGRARTGTGKTVAFLLPAIERIVQLGVQDDPTRVGILIVSPTRELATQIGDQAEKMIAYHKNMSVQVMFGGTNVKQDINRLSSKIPTILVVTPGRLLDHLQSTSIRMGGGRNLSFGRDVMSQTPILVLDETDRLLDMGFRNEITKIMNYLPNSKQRQTLLFSATIPPDLKTIMAQNMNKDYIEVDCINDGDAASHTNAQVQQSHMIIPSESGRTVSAVIEIVKLAVDRYDTPDTPAKVVVFFPTARLVNFYAEVFNEGKILSQPVLELHSKKSQPYRTKVSDKFRAMTRGVLFTSDVSARGVDYPNVSHVIQFGMPESRDQYIHRLGRTGRGGTDGKGWLVLSDWESKFLKELKGVEIPLNEELQELIANQQISPQSRDQMEAIRRRVRAGDQVLTGSATGAYQAFLGYYLGQMKRMGMNRKEELVDIANDFASLAGLSGPPELSRDLIGKMGLKGVGGINIGGGRDSYNSDRNGGSQGHRNSRQGHEDGRRPQRNSSGGDRRR